MARTVPILLAIVLSFVQWSAGQSATTAGGAVITSKKMTFDYKRLIAEFNGNVVVIDPQIRIESDDMTMVFNSTNEVRSVTAIGNVVIKQVDKTATCGKAIYFSPEGKVILIGNAKVARGADVVTGDEITYWFSEERMLVKGGSKLVITPEKDQRQGAGDIFTGKKKPAAHEREKNRGE